MEDKFTAVYVMVRQEELKALGEASYEKPLAKQQEQCLRFLKERENTNPEEPVEVYKNLNQLLMDVERQKVKRIVIYNVDRLGSSQEERAAILFELGAAGVEVLTVTE